MSPLARAELSRYNRIRREAKEHERQFQPRACLLCWGAAVLAAALGVFACTMWWMVKHG